MTHDIAPISPHEAAASEFLLGGLTLAKLKNLRGPGAGGQGTFPADAPVGEVARHIHRLSLIDSAVARDSADRWLALRAALRGDGNDAAPDAAGVARTTVSSRQLASLLSLAQDVGALNVALWEARDHVVTRAARWYDAWPGPVREDPLVLREFGRWWSKLRAANLLFTEIVDSFDREADHADLTDRLASAENYTRRLSARLFSEIFELTGASAMRRIHDADRHWRSWSVASGARNAAGASA